MMFGREMIKEEKGEEMFSEIGQCVRTSWEKEIYIPTFITTEKFYEHVMRVKLLKFD